MTRVAIATLLILCTLTGCKSGPAPQSQPNSTISVNEPERTERTDRSAGERERRHSRDRDDVREGSAAAAGTFDSYLLNLSWSPEYCATQPHSEECGGHLGFVLHGLWPEDSGGRRGPENCGNAPGPNPSELAGIIPTPYLVQHEWETHGTCSGLAPEAWVQSLKTAYAEVKIPATFATGRTPAMLPPQEIVDEFATANPSFPQGSILLSCGNNQLTAIEVCMDKSLHPQACDTNIHSCRANAVKITPR